MCIVLDDLLYRIAGSIVLIGIPTEYIRYSFVLTIVYNIVLTVSNLTKIQVYGVGKSKILKPNKVVRGFKFYKGSKVWYLTSPGYLPKKFKLIQKGNKEIYYCEDVCEYFLNEGIKNYYFLIIDCIIYLIR